jgi:hypothetical protein
LKWDSLGSNLGSISLQLWYEYTPSLGLFPYVQNGNSNSTYSIGWWEGLNELLVSSPEEVFCGCQYMSLTSPPQQASPQVMLKSLLLKQSPLSGSTFFTICSL